jgi:hypothetical protein
MVWSIFLGLQNSLGNDAIMRDASTNWGMSAGTIGNSWMVSYKWSPFFSNDEDNSLELKICLLIWKRLINRRLLPDAGLI